MGNPDKQDHGDLEGAINLCLSQNGFKQRLQQLGIQEETVKVFLRGKMQKLDETRNPLEIAMALAHNLINMNLRPDIQRGVLETLSNDWLPERK